MLINHNIYWNRGSSVMTEAKNSINSKLQIKFNEAAADTQDGWEQYSLPIGNGSMGATIFGGIEQDRIQFNEKTLWKGGPSESRPDYYGGNSKNKYPHYKEIQSLLLQGETESALKLLHHLEGDKEADGYGTYLNFGDIYISDVLTDGQTTNLDSNQNLDANPNSNPTNYQRSLNLGNALATISYEQNNTSYQREYFASFPHKLIVIRYRSNNAKFNKQIEMKSAQSAQSQIFPMTFDSPQNATTIIRDNLEDNNMLYEVLKNVSTSDGTIMAKADGTIIVQDASEFVIMLTAGTDYKSEFPKYRGEDPHDKLLQRISIANKLSYDELFKTHVEDHQSLFNRLSFAISGEEELSEFDLVDKATDELLTSYKSTNTAQEDSYLEVLLFQYGRYLTISSSRAEEGALPSNLQGVWNNSNTPPWNDDYHLNINLQMNYWPAYNCNLSECALPLIDFVDSLRQPGRITAKEYLGVESTPEQAENGFSAHTQNNIFGWTAPGWDFYWGWSPGVIPWILQNVWEYYEYTLDEDMLRDKIYPMMKETVSLYEQILVWDEGSQRLVSAPSYSPEHGPVSIGNTYEQSLIWQLYEDTIKAAKILNQDLDSVSAWQDTQSKLDPIHIGSDGQIKEWFEETSLGSVEKYEEQHRHISHLLGLYPGDLISTDTPEWLEAAKVTLLDRGDENTSWSMAQKMNTWARIRDGEHSYGLISKMLQTCVFPNLWTLHPPFQIDGNFGYTAGIAEMLLQSNLDVIDVLPALPRAWKNGQITGLKARGAYEVDIAWANHSLERVLVKAKYDGESKLRLNLANATDLSSITILEHDGSSTREVNANVLEDELISISMKAGNSYLIKIV